MKADRGMYVRSPFDALLAITAQESVDNRCIVIGEDLGTVPENFRETLADWGMWSYHVMVFERLWGGAFREPQDYRQNALASCEIRTSSSSTNWWRIPPSPPFVVPDPSRPRSRSKTSRSPRSVRKNAAATPTMPPPTMTVDAVRCRSLRRSPRSESAPRPR